MVDAKPNNDLNAADEGDKNHIPTELSFLMLPNRDNFPNKPYYDDGNPEMYTDENIKKRNDLRDNDTVKDAITEFMRDKFHTTGQGAVSKDEYFRVFVKIGMILRPGIDADDLQKMIKDEWEQDVQDRRDEGEPEDDNMATAAQADFLDHQKLYNAIFELVDIWCPDIDEFQYKKFLELLDHRLTYEGQQDSSAYDVLP